MIKKAASLILAITVIFGVIGVFPATAAKSSTDIAYPVDGGKIYFNPATGTITGYDGDIINLTIPEKMNGVAVTSIGVMAFYKCSALESVTMPSVTSIYCC